MRQCDLQQLQFQSNLCKELINEELGQSLFIFSPTFTKSSNLNAKIGLLEKL